MIAIGDYGGYALTQ